MPGVVTINNSAFVCKFHVRPECREEFNATFDTLWRNSLDFMNAQCNFVFYGWGRDENEFVAIESYKDEELLAGLRASDEFQVMVGKLLGLCDKPMVLEIFNGMATGRSVFELYPSGPSKVHPSNGEIGGVFV